MKNSRPSALRKTKKYNSSTISIDNSKYFESENRSSQTLKHPAKTSSVVKDDGAGVAMARSEYLNKVAARRSKAVSSDRPQPSSIKRRTASVKQKEQPRPRVSIAERRQSRTIDADASDEEVLVGVVVEDEDAAAVAALSDDEAEEEGDDADDSVFTELVELKPRDTTESLAIDFFAKDERPPRKTLSVIDEEDSVDQTGVYRAMKESAPMIEFTYEPDDMITLERERCRCKSCHQQHPSLMTMLTANRASTYKHSVSSAYNADENDSDSMLASLSEVSIGKGSEYAIFSLNWLRPTRRMLDLTQHSEDGCENAEFAWRWNFLRYPDRMFFAPPPVSDDELPFEYTRMYVFGMTQPTHRYLSRCVMQIELQVRCEYRKFKMVGCAELSMRDGLMEPNRQFTVSLDVNNKLLRAAGLNTPFTSYGELEVSYLFGGDKSKYDESRFVKPPFVEIPAIGNGGYHHLLRHATNPTVQADPRSLDALELKAFQTGLNLTLIRNAALKVTPEDIASELKARVDWMHQELLWRLTLQENAILGGADPSAVRWRQWKDENIAHVKYRPNGNDYYKQTKRAEFSITIVEFQINPSSRILNDDRIVQLYVEYTFLHHTGIQLETPSLLKPDSDYSVYYNFTKKFVVEERDKSARLFAEMVRNNESITFTVVSEPLPNHSAMQTCVDLGSCQINMFELVQNDGDELSRYFAIADHWDPAGEVGKLKIEVSGISSMRALALRTLTPEHFNIIR